MVTNNEGMQDCLSDNLRPALEVPSKSTNCTLAKNFLHLQ